MKVLRKVLLGVALATGLAGAMTSAEPQAQAAPQGPRFIVMYGFRGSGVFPYCGADTADINYANTARGVLIANGWDAIIVNASTP